MVFMSKFTAPAFSFSTTRHSIIPNHSGQPKINHSERLNSSIPDRDLFPAKKKTKPGGETELPCSSGDLKATRSAAGSG